MRRSTFLPLILAASLFLAAPAFAQTPDEQGVHAALDHYMAGHAKSDPAEFRQAFHDDFRMFIIRDGNVIQRTDDEYIAGVSGKPAADEAQRKRSVEFISVSGDVAVAKLVLDYPDAYITDYMSLLKTSDGWKIINKVVNVQPAKPKKPN